MTTNPKPPRPYRTGLTARLYIRIKPENKAKLVRIAAVLGTSVERLVNDTVEMMEE